MPVVCTSTSIASCWRSDAKLEAVDVGPSHHRPSVQTRSQARSRIERLVVVTRAAAFHRRCRYRRCALVSGQARARSCACLRLAWRRLCDWQRPYSSTTNKQHEHSIDRSIDTSTTRVGSKGHKKGQCVVTDRLAISRQKRCPAARLESMVARQR